MIESAQQWVSMAGAAARMGVSLRTLQRRLAAGEHDSRVSHGRKEVLLDAAVKPDVTNARQGDNVAGPVTDLDVARATAVFARERLGALGGELQRSRRWTLAGWAAVLLLLAGIGAGGWFVSRTLTTSRLRGATLALDVLNARKRHVTAQSRLEAAQARLDALTAGLATATAQADVAGKALEAERQARSRAEGELLSSRALVGQLTAEVRTLEGLARAAENTAAGPADLSENSAK